MKRLPDWVLDWWGESEREANLNDALGLPARRPHWSAKMVRIAGAFYLRQWQWVWATVIGLLGLCVAILSIKN